jgi:hypothetical protein
MAAQLKNIYYEMFKTKISCEHESVSHKGRTFTLCNSCFWCASILYDDKRPFRPCPTCKNYDLEFMPISVDETYKFDHDKRRGVTLEFIHWESVLKMPVEHWTNSNGWRIRWRRNVKIHEKYLQSLSRGETQRLFWVSLRVRTKWTSDGVTFPCSCPVEKL